MRLTGLIGILFVAAFLVDVAAAQSLYVFPAQGQSEEQMEQDKFSCHQWAVGETNYDPMNPPAAQPAATGAVIEEPLLNCSHYGGGRGAVRGAAKGYVGGKVVDGKTSKSTKLGAATGAIKGNQTKKACEQENAQRRQRNEQRRAQAEQQAAAAGGPPPGTADDYTRAYSVCLEAKGYQVK